MVARLDVGLQSIDPFPGQTVGNQPSTIGYYLVNQNAVAFTFTNPSTFTTTAAHNLVVGSKVWFLSQTGITGLNSNTVYFVKSVPTSTTFTVSAVSPTGAVFTSATPGSGTYSSSLTGTTHTLYMQPQRFGELWVINRVTIQSTSVTLVPSAAIYRGVANPTALIDSTFAAQFNTDDLSSPMHLRAGEPIVISFTKVDPPQNNTASICTVYLTGTTTR